jgi:hypothetical protein
MQLNDFRNQQNLKFIDLPGDYLLPAGYLSAAGQLYLSAPY